MHKYMIIKHLMHEESYKDRKNQIKDQKSISSTIGTFLIQLNECLMRSETRVGRMRIEDVHRQGGKNIKNFLQQLIIFPQIRFCFHSTTSKKLKFLFSFNSFKSLKLKAIRYKMTKDTTVVTNNGFMSSRHFKEGSNNMIFFFLQQGTLRSYVTDYTTMVASWNKLIHLKPQVKT